MIDIRQQADPAPHEIAERCREIQAEWTDAERTQRMRADRRPGRGLRQTTIVRPVGECGTQR